MDNIWKTSDYLRNTPVVGFFNTAVSYPTGKKSNEREINIKSVGKPDYHPVARLRLEPGRLRWHYLACIGYCEDLVDANWPHQEDVVPLEDVLPAGDAGQKVQVLVQVIPKQAVQN